MTFYKHYFSNIISRKNLNLKGDTLCFLDAAHMVPFKL